jgi:hypothetical protein
MIETTRIIVTVVAVTIFTIILYRIYRAENPKATKLALDLEDLYLEYVAYEYHCGRDPKSNPSFQDMRDATLGFKAMMRENGPGTTIKTPANNCIHMEPMYHGHAKGAFTDITSCVRCNLVGLYEDLHPARPCPDCGGDVVESGVAKWEDDQWQKP